MVEGQDFTELLKGPFRRGVFGDIEMQNPTAADFHRHEHIQDAKGGRHRHEEIAGHHRLGVVPHKAASSLAGCPARPFKYLRTVRDDTRMPSLSCSSFAIRSSPQVGFSRPISWISTRRFLGSFGRPGWRDFQRQKIRKAVRCQ